MTSLRGLHFAVSSLDGLPVYPDFVNPDQMVRQGIIVEVDSIAACFFARKCNSVLKIKMDNHVLLHVGL